MMICRSGYTVMGLVLLLTVMAVMVAAQARESAPDSQRPAIKAELTRLLHYLELEGKVATPEFEQLIDLKLNTLVSDATPEQRQAAYKEFFVLLYRMQGNAPPQGEAEAQLAGLAQTAASVPATAPLSASGWATTTTPPGRFGHVEKLGHGPLPLILIPNQEDWSVYKSFMERHAAQFTMYAVTLPGYGNTPPPPRPERMDFSQLAWWCNAEQAILNLIAEHKLVKPLLVGTMMGGYLAARVALHHPEQVRGAVLLNALVYAGEPQPLAERLRQAKQGLAAFPSSELLPWSRRPPAEAVRQAIEQNPQALTQIKNWAQDAEVAKQLVINATTNNHPLTARYLNELATTDLTDELKKLRVPLLVIPALPDKDSPYQGKVSLTQFEAVKAQQPALPLTIVPFEDVRSYILFEAATELGKAFEDFAAGRPVVGKRRDTALQNAAPNP
jgi:pimeloyl-ACP methyl ester carboxylesterase